jgi:hypothetical protein
MQMLINFPGERIGAELAALAVNMSWASRNAAAMCHYPKKNQGLYEVRAFGLGGPLSCFLRFPVLNCCPDFTFRCGGFPFFKLMQRAVAKRDPLVMKIIRNLAAWTFNLQHEAAAAEPSTEPPADAARTDAFRFGSGPGGVAGARAGGGEPSGGYEQRGLWGRHIEPLLELLVVRGR